MRIGIVALNSSVGVQGGTAVYVRTLLEAIALHETKDEIVVLSTPSTLDAWTSRKWPDNYTFAAVDPQTHMFRVGRYCLRTLGRDVSRFEERAFARIFDSMKLDVLHFPCSVIGNNAIRTPCVMTLFDIQHEYYPQFFTEDELADRNAVTRPSVSKARHVTVPTEYTRETLIKKYQVSLDKITVLPVGLPMFFEKPSPTEIDRIKNRYSLPDVFLYYPGNPWHHKNHARLMAALRIYREIKGDAPWLVLSGRLRGERRDFLSLAVAAGVDDKVIDLGFVDREHMPAIYGAATAMVFPSLFEGFGLPLIEAMACGCPIVASNTTTIPEITNGSGLLFDPLDPWDIAHAMMRIIEEPPLRLALVDKGYRQLKRFDWANIVPALFTVYKQVARRG